MANLEVEICGVKFKNPVVGASGTVGFGREFNGLYDLAEVGGISTKGMTLEPRLGNPVPRIAEGTSVILNPVGWQAKGYAVIANVAGKTLEDYGAICAKLDGLVDMVELNISCPNVKAGGMAFGIKPESIKEVTKTAKASLSKTPLIVKLSPNVESIVVNAQAAQSGGADCISLINTLTGMVIDIERRKPLIANNTGGVSGAGIKPVAVRMVYEAAHAVNIPVIGMGGITCAEDAIEFLMAGAKAVQVGTANFTNPNAMPEIINGLNAWLDKHNIADVNEIIGVATLN